MAGVRHKCPRPVQGASTKTTSVGSGGAIKMSAPARAARRSSSSRAFQRTSALATRTRTQIQDIHSIEGTEASHRELTGLILQLEPAVFEACEGPHIGATEQLQSIWCRPRGLSLEPFGKKTLSQLIPITLEAIGPDRHRRPTSLRGPKGCRTFWAEHFKPLLCEGQRQ